MTRPSVQLHVSRVFSLLRAKQQQEKKKREEDLEVRDGKLFDSNTNDPLRLAR